MASEDVEMKERGYQEVRNVHQLVNVEINGGAGEHVGLLARQPPRPNEVINHIERRIPSRERQILALVFSSYPIHGNARRGEEPLRHRPLGGGEEVVPLKLESGDPQPRRLAFPEPKLDDQSGIHLHRGPSDLPVTLRVVRVAGRKERPVHEHRNKEGPAFGELLDVDVPGVLARGDRPQASAGEQLARPA